MIIKNPLLKSTRPEFVFKAREHTLSLGPSTVVMGIVNITPDSFSGDGVIQQDTAFRLALRQIRDGAGIIDLGGESSRPGARKVSADEEIQRVIPVIKKLAKIVKVPISVDTYKELTALQALDAGASIINNIQGIKTNRSLLKMAARYHAGIILMHMRGTPKTMQSKTHYKDLITDILRDLKTALENCLENGIKSDNIIVDPGIGFAKTAEQNLEIIDRLNEFKVLQQPVLIGTSRKSFIEKVLLSARNDRLVQKDLRTSRLAGTIASSVLAAAHGAHLIRVHDVLETKQAILVADAVLNRTVAA